MRFQGMVQHNPYSNTLYVNKRSESDEFSWVNMGLPETKMFMNNYAQMIPESKINQ